MKIQIRYTTESSQWGSDTTDEQAVTIAENVTALAEAYARKNWPDAEVDARVSHEARLTAVDAFAREDEEAESDEAVLWIKEYIGRHWCEEALWVEDFDADAYLAAHPN